MFFLMKFPTEERNLIDLKKGEYSLVEIKLPPCEKFTKFKHL